MMPTPTIGFVIEAMRNSVSARIGSRVSRSMTPCDGDVGHFAAARDDGDRAREVAGGDALLEHRVDALEPLARQADVFGICRGSGGGNDGQRGRRNDD